MVKKLKSTDHYFCVDDPTSTYFMPGSPEDPAQSDWAPDSSESPAIGTSTSVSTSSPTDVLYLQQPSDPAAIDINDISQGQVGDCFLLAVIGELALFDPNAIMSMIQANADGTETVTLFANGDGSLLDLQATTSASSFQSVAVTVNNTFPADAVNNNQAPVTGQTEIWVQVLEKAVATLYAADGGYSLLNVGGYSNDAMELLTGSAATLTAAPTITAAQLITDQESGDLITFGTGPGASTALDLIDDHEYAYEGITMVNGTPMVQLYNPWGAGYYTPGSDVVSPTLMPGELPNQPPLISLASLLNYLDTPVDNIVGSISLLRPRPAILDLSGDGKSDILWQNASGNVVDWTMNGTQATSETLLGGNSNWSVVGTGDFNGDGKSDLLWQNASGNVVEWLMNGSQSTTTAFIGGDSGWKVVGTGDFTGDGTSDILWQNLSGNVIDWTMDGTKTTSMTFIGGNSGWKIIGTDDFTGNGKSDILWQNAAGNVSLSIMNGSQATSTAILGGDDNWKVVGTGDFSGDGRADILWQDLAGAVVQWTMNGTQVTGSTVLGGNTDWRIIGTGDYTGDGKSDILWASPTGAVAEWIMNGAQVTSSAIIGGGGTWKPVML